MTGRLGLLRVVYVVYFLVVAFIVFVPTASVPSDSVDLISRGLDAIGAPTWTQGDTVEFVTNILLFVPLSVIGSVFKPDWGLVRWTLVGLAGSILIELTQLALLPDRSAQWRDLVSNSLGALLGAVLARALERTLRATSTSPESRLDRTR
jgi:glycopeptide antibiotics resistance protein